MLAFELIDIGKDIVNAVVLLKQFLRGFCADACDTFDTIRCVAHEGEIVDDLTGLDAKFFFDPCDVIAFVIKAVFHDDAGIDQLAHIFVACGDDDMMTF